MESNSMTYYDQVEIVSEMQRWFNVMKYMNIFNNNYIFLKGLVVIFMVLGKHLRKFKVDS